MLLRLIDSSPLMPKTYRFHQQVTANPLMQFQELFIELDFKAFSGP